MYRPDGTHATWAIFIRGRISILYLSLVHSKVLPACSDLFTLVKNIFIFYNSNRDNNFT